MSKQLIFFTGFVPAKVNSIETNLLSFQTGEEMSMPSTVVVDSNEEPQS